MVDFQGSPANEGMRNKRPKPETRRGTTSASGSVAPKSKRSIGAKSGANPVMYRAPVPSDARSEPGSLPERVHHDPVGCLDSTSEPTGWEMQGGKNQ